MTVKQQVEVAIQRVLNRGWGAPTEAKMAWARKYSCICGLYGYSHADCPTHGDTGAHQPERFGDKGVTG